MPLHSSWKNTVITLHQSFSNTITFLIFKLTLINQIIRHLIILSKNSDLKPPLQMKNLISIILKSPQSIHKHNKISQLIPTLNKNTASFIIQYGASTTPKDTPVTLLRWIMLIHKLHLEKFKLNDWYNQEIQKLCISKECKIEQDTDRQIYNILPGYLQYIKKRCLKLPEWTFETPNVEDYQGRIKFCYQIINLIRFATTFNHVYYTFGRYFQSKYPQISDFSILMAQDVKELYNLMAGKFNTLWRLAEMGHDQNIDKEQVELLHSEIQSLNESLNYLYYNLYYVDTLRLHIPNWVRVQSNRPRKGSKDSTKSSDQLKEITKSIERLKTQISHQNSNIVGYFQRTSCIFEDLNQRSDCNKKNFL